MSDLDSKIDEAIADWDDAFDTMAGEGLVSITKDLQAKLCAMQELMPEIKSILSFLSWEDTTTDAQGKRIHKLLKSLEVWENE